MTNDEILAVLNNTKVKPKVVSKPQKPKRQYEEGDTRKYKGKPINREKFLMAVNGILNYGMSIREAYKLSGLSKPTFEKRANEYLINGFIPAYLVEDGHQIDFQIEPPDQYELIKHELQRLEKKRK